MLLSSRKDITLLYINFSRTLDNEHSRDTGLGHLFSYNGITLAIFRISGNIPSFSERLQTYV